LQTIEFTLPVQPLSTQFGGRRLTVVKGRIKFFKQQKVQSWSQAIEWHSLPYRPKEPLTGPLALKLVFVLARPKRMRKGEREYCPARPDCDNLTKGLQDALRGFWADDAQVCELRVSKWYAASGEFPCIEVKLRQL
jgi:Holliday junction resolvase RusA-like endonuclease